MLLPLGDAWVRSWSGACLCFLCSTKSGSLRPTWAHDMLLALFGYSATLESLLSLNASWHGHNPILTDI